MRFILLIIGLFSCNIGLVASLKAQNMSSEQQVVRLCIDKIFEGMKNCDSALVRSVFHETARMQSISKDANGQSVIRTENSISGFLKAIVVPKTERWDERVSEYNIRIDGDMATAWTPYRFYLGEKFLHEGVNAFQLFRTEKGWKIIHIVDTRRK